VIIGAATWLIYETGLIHFFFDDHAMIAFIDSLGVWGVVGFISLQVLQVVAAPIPGEVTGFVGGFLYGPVMGVVWSTIGLTIGSLAAFSLSRYFGRPFVEKFVDRETIARFDYLLHHKGVFLIFLLFLIPGTPKDFLCYILGLGHLSLLQFLVIGGVGRLFGTMLLSVGGDLIRNREYQLFFLLVSITAAVVILTLIFRKKIERLFRLLHAYSYLKGKKEAAGKKKDRGPASKR
jgi:uncharacterized membrane protein YdjX (TVP38/TMEM64 family)